MKGKCVIIGAGIVGMLSARFMSALGMEALVLERAGVGEEASGNAAGLLFPLYPNQSNATELDDIVYSHSYYKNMLEEFSAQERQQIAFEKRRIVWRGDTVAIVHPLLTGSQTKKDYIFSQGHTLDPRALMRYLPSHINARVVKDEEVIKIEADTNCVSRVTTVITKKSRYECDILIICAGARSTHLLSGAPQAVVPIKGYLLCYNPQRWVLPEPILVGANYAVQHRIDCLLVGSSSREAGFDYSIDEEAISKLEKFAESVIPNIVECDRKVLVGLRPYCEDGTVCERHHRFENCYWHYGHGYHGISITPATSNRLSTMISSTD